MIHEQNANVLSILPSVATNLVSKISYVDLIYIFLDKQIEISYQNQLKLDRLLHIKSQIQAANLADSKYSVDIDAKRSVMLACTFGELYTAALGLLTGKNISIQIWDPTPGMGSFETVSEYVENPGDRMVIFRVAKTPETVKEEEVWDVNPFLQLRTMVAKVGLDLNLTTFNIERSKAPKEASCDVRNENEQIEFADQSCQEGTKSGPTPANGVIQMQDFESTTQFIDFEDPEHVITDPSRWFCSCNEFTNGSFVVHDRTATDILGAVAGPWALTDILKSSDCFYSRNLPLCQHLLAVSLLLCNWTVSVDQGLVSTLQVGSNESRDD